MYCLLFMTIPLSVLITADFRSREVSLLWLLIFVAGALLSAVLINGLGEVLYNIATNVMLLAYFFCGIMLYLRMRNRKWVNPLKEHIGAGDVIFLLGLAPLYELRGYLLLIAVALLLSVVWYGAAWMIRRKPATIPLVATAGIVFGCDILRTVYGLLFQLS